MPTLHAFEYLSDPAAHAASPVNVLFGGEPFLTGEVLRCLREQLLGDDPEAVPHTVFEGGQLEWRDLADELSTAGLFGASGRRLVIVRAADAFAGRESNRARLEDFASTAKGRNVLVLVADTWAANTRLYKIVHEHGLQIDCRPPQKTGRKGEIDETAVARWLEQWAPRRHRVKLGREAAAALVELVGAEIGLLDQDLAKLALHVEIGGAVSAEMVHDIIGGWRAKTAWELIDAALEGRTAEALLQLQRLTQSGEHPLALLAQVSFTLRRYAAATRLFEAADRAGRRLSLRAALEEAGVKDWPRGKLAQAEKNLRRLGRHRAGALYRWLLDTDLALKGSHSEDARARLALELLLLRLAGAAPVA